MGVGRGGVLLEKKKYSNTSTKNDLVKSCRQVIHYDPKAYLLTTLKSLNSIREMAGNLRISVRTCL